MYTKRAELKAGLIVLLALVVLLGLLYYATGITLPWEEKEYVYLRFEQGTIAPSRGDEVSMLGRPVGKIVEVAFDQETISNADLTGAQRSRLPAGARDTSDYLEIYVVAKMQVEPGFRLPRGTYGTIGTTVTQSVQLQLIPGGAPDNPITPEETRQTPIRVSERAGLDQLLSSAKLLITQIQEFIDNGDQAVSDVRGLIQGISAKIELFDTGGISDEAKAAISSLRRSMETLEGRLDTIADNVENATATLNTMASTGSETMTELREGLRKVLANLDSASAGINRIVTKAEPQVERLLADLTSTASGLVGLASEFRGLGPEAQGVIRNVGVDAERFMKTINDAATALLNAAEDIQTHPWKILNEPKADQIAFENLVQAMRSYNQAMRDVDEVSRRLRSLLARPDVQSPEIQELLKRSVREFESSMSRYRDSQRRFTDILRSARVGAPQGQRPPR